jgi:EpsI family protein
MYVGYYGTRRGGRPEHTPDVCYPSAGWRIESSEVWSGASDPGLRANEMIVERRGQRRLVHYWYRSARTPVLLGLLPVSVDQLSGRLATGRADSALVTLSTPLEQGALDGARERLLDLRRPLEIELAARWPNETPRG